MLRIECPECKTSYAASRLGIELMPEQWANVTVKCITCKKDFDARIEPRYVTNEVGWFQRYVLLRQPTSELKGHQVTDSRLR